MVKSMTGFGRAEETVGDKTFLVDVKSLNGKQFELQLKLPGFLKPYEFDIRKLLSEKLGRGSLDCTHQSQTNGKCKTREYQYGSRKSVLRNPCRFVQATQPGSLQIF